MILVCINMQHTWNISELWIAYITTIVLFHCTNIINIEICEIGNRLLLLPTPGDPPPSESCWSVPPVCFMLCTGRIWVGTVELWDLVNFHANFNVCFPFKARKFMKPKYMISVLFICNIRVIRVSSLFHQASTVSSAFTYLSSSFSILPCCALSSLSYRTAHEGWLSEERDSSNLKKKQEKIALKLPRKKTWPSLPSWAKLWSRWFGH